MIKQYRLDGLDCANCAAKIEKKVSSLPNVKQANIQFATQTLTIEQQMKHILTSSQVSKQ